MRSAGQLALLGLCLAACRGMESDLHDGLSRLLEQHNPYCLLVHLQTEPPPWRAAERDPRLAGLERFEELGLLRSEAIQIEDEGWNAYGRTKSRLPGKSYSLTSEGEAALHVENTLGLRRHCFRYAQPEIVDILEWTEPADAMGQVVTNVSYTMRPSHIAAWAQHERFARLFPEQAKRLERPDPESHRAALTKTNKGWRPLLEAQTD